MTHPSSRGNVLDDRTGEGLVFGGGKPYVIASIDGIIWLLESSEVISDIQKSFFIV